MTLTRLFIPVIAAASLASCERHEPIATTGPEPAPAQAPAAAEMDPVKSVVRVNATQQHWSAGQPWEKDEPRRRRSLGAIVGPGQVLTTAEMAADATYLEFESTDGRKQAPAKVVAVDYEANLALLATEDEQTNFFDDLEPLEIASYPVRGDEIDILQVGDNGLPLVTHGTVQGVDVVSSFLPGQYFLTYQLKGSLQTAASSYSLPALRDGKFAGLLTSYDSDDQLSDILATEIVSRFLDDARDGTYQGFPSLGIQTASLEDPKFRDWLGLEGDAGGIYVSAVRKDGAAGKAGIEKGDVITSIDGHPIDQQGYFEHPQYGRLFWSHLIRGSKTDGEAVALELVRKGEKQTIEASLVRQEPADELIPIHIYGSPPHFLVKGGFIFQELTRPLLGAFGKDGESSAPLELLEPLENPEAFREEMDHVIFLSGVIPTPATLGYERMRNLIVSEVNGEPVRDMKSLGEAFDQVPSSGLHSIKFREEEFPIYLDEVTSTAVDEQLIQRGLTKLSRVE